MQGIIKFVEGLYNKYMQTQLAQTYPLQMTAVLWAAGVCLIYGIIMFFWNHHSGNDHHPIRFFVGTVIIIIAAFFLTKPFLEWYDTLDDTVKSRVPFAGFVLVVFVWAIIKSKFVSKEREGQEQAVKNPPEDPMLTKFKTEHPFERVCPYCFELCNEIARVCPHCGRTIRPYDYD